MYFQENILPLNPPLDGINQHQTYNLLTTSIQAKNPSPNNYYTYPRTYYMNHLQPNKATSKQKKTKCKNETKLMDPD